MAPRPAARSEAPDAGAARPQSRARSRALDGLAVRFGLLLRSIGRPRGIVDADVGEVVHAVRQRLAEPGAAPIRLVGVSGVAAAAIHGSYDVVRERRAGAGLDATHVSPEALVAVVARHGDADDRARTMAHVDACARCRRDYDLLLASATAGQRVVTAAWRPSAIAALVLLVTAVTLTVIGRRAAARADAAGIAAAGGGASAPSGVADDRFAAPAAPAVIETIETIGSGIGWRAVPGAQSYHLQITDSIGVPVLTTDLSDTTFVPAAGLLSPGRHYRWWVSATDAAGRVRRSAATTVAGVASGR